jgi:hypothetical protein
MHIESMDTRNPVDSLGTGEPTKPKSDFVEDYVVAIRAGHEYEGEEAP